jgi:asparagine synthase (glutamine-hydrolysing)
MPCYAQPAGAVAVSITGGLDTRMILSCLPPEALAMSYTYAGPVGETLDTMIGRRVAESRGLTHRLLRLEPDFFENFPAHVDRAVFVSDGTGGATMAHEFYLSERARGIAPVRLTGNYGSEIFRRVSTYKPIGLDPSLLAGDFTRWSGRRRATANRTDGARSAAFREVPFHLAGLRAIADSLLTLRTPFLDNELVDLALQASPACLATAGPALRLVRKCWPELAEIPTDRGVRWPDRGPAHLARRAWSEALFKLDYLHAEGASPVLRGPVRAAVRATARLGLYTPHRFLAYPQWFQGRLANYVRDVAGSGRVSRSPYWNRARLDTMVAEHCQGVRNRTAEINAILTLAAIDRTLLQGAAHIDEEPIGLLGAA